MGLSQSHLLQFDDKTQIHQQMKTAFVGLQKAALQAGFNLKIASGFRDFHCQKLIWNNKYLGKRPILDENEQALDLAKLNEKEKLLSILHWSALPGASRHHWGCDIDIYDPSLLPENKSLQLTCSEYDQSGYFQDLVNWLDENKSTFDFYLPYQTYQGGVAREPWHISYRPLAEIAMQQYNEEILYHLINKEQVEGKVLILEQLPLIYKQFITNVCH